MSCCVSSGRRSYSKVDDTNDLEYVMTNLIEGNSYGARVAAENTVGVGEFVELRKPVVPKSQHGRIESVMAASVFINRDDLTFLNCKLIFSLNLRIR